MASIVQKSKLSASRSIRFNKLVLNQSNVRRVKAGISIEPLAESIALRTLLQDLSIWAVIAREGQETHLFEVPTGGRRYRALERLVKQKHKHKTQPVPCMVLDDSPAEDNSLAENRGPHPLDPFRAVQRLRDGGMSGEEMAARHILAQPIIKQRPRHNSGGRIIDRKVSVAWAASSLDSGLSKFVPDTAFLTLMHGKAVLDLADGLRRGRVHVIRAYRTERSTEREA